MGLELLLSEALQHAKAAAEAAPARVDIWMIPLLPVFGFVFQVFVGRRLPKPVPGFVACATVIASAALSWMLFRELRGMDPHHRAITARLGDWIRVPGLDGALAVVADHKLVVDPLTAVMILVITNIGSLIHIYSLGYMAEEKRYARYFAYLNLFTGFMLILVMASNLILMFVGWEGVGLCSYLLIGFWYEKKENALAGMKAFIVNRVGDLAFTIGALTLFVYLGRQFGIWTVDFAEIGAAIGKHKGEFSGGVATFVAVMLFIGATGKSAQLPLYTWLPDAMAGPTPVSALIHAATMVTAGVYMVARMNFLYALSPTAMAVVATVGAATALFAGTIGIAQNDIKKVLAYSTVSQLGFMFMGVGVGAFAAGIFHLFTHAFFKACLFLGSGSVIHGMGGEQDIRKMGALRSKMPWTWATFGLATLAIAGLPPFAGFFSKDEILWQAWNTHAFSNAWGKVIWLTGVVAAACTAFYMVRLVLKTFHGRAQWQQATAFSGGGVDLPDWLNEEEEKKKKAGEPGKPKDGKGAEGLPAWMDDPHGQSLPQDESLLDLGSIKKKPEPEPPPADDHGHAHDLPQDESLLDLGKMSASASHDEHAPADAAPPSDPHAHDDARAHADARDGHGHDPAGGHGHGHGHAGEPHECPWSMRFALVVLALCSVAVGFLGVPPALHGGDLFGHWLEPVVGSVHAKPEPGQPAHHDPVEYVLMAGSVLVALFGIGLAVRIYKLRNGVPAKDFAEAHPDLYKLVLDKYRVDEMYDATVVQPLLAANECAGRFDNAVIDGAVNGAGTVAAGSSKGVGVFDNEVVDAGVNAAALATEAAGKKIRRLQTGNIKEYLTFALVGGLFVIAFFCVVLTWPGLSDRIRRFFGG